MIFSVFVCLHCLNAAATHLSFHIILSLVETKNPRPLFPAKLKLISLEKFRFSKCLNLNSSSEAFILDQTHSV